MAVGGNQGVTKPVGSYNSGAVVQGPRAISNVGAGRKVPQVDPNILQINKNIVPFTMFMEKLGRKRTVRQLSFVHIEEDRQPATVTIDDGTTDGLGAAAGYASNDTTIGFKVANGGSGVGSIQANTILKCVRTGEMFAVVSVTGEVATVAARGYISNGAAAAALLANEELQVLGSAFPDNSQAPQSMSVEPLLITSYPQLFRTAVEAGRRLIRSEEYGGDEYKRMLASSLLDHHLKVEKAFLFNQGYLATGNTQTDGFINQIVTNVFQMNGVLDEVTLENYWKALSRYNAGDEASIVTFVGENAMVALDQFGRDGLRFTPATETIGIAVREWQCSFGSMKFKQHGLFGPLGGSTTAANGGYVGYLVSANMKNLGMATYDGGNLKFDPNCKLPGQDGEKACWTEDKGLEVWNERTHGIISGITG